MTGKTISHYKILEKIGEGGMGVVYKALDTRLDRTVALKFLPDHAAITSRDQERFLKEAQSAARLNHVNICQIYSVENVDNDFGDEQPFIVTEYVDGITLRQKIQNETGTQDPSQPDASGQKPSQTPADGHARLETIIDYATQIVKGLQAAHDSGIVHRDIKSGNIIVTKSGEIKILDFGLAKMTGADQVTKTGATMGTVAYMSPEQVRGEPADERSDIWSTGVVCYEMLTGRLPFEGDYEYSIIYSIVNTDPPTAASRNPQVPDDLDRIVQRCMTKDPADRYPSASDLLDDLQNAAKALRTGETATGDAIDRRSFPPLATRQRAVSTAAILLAGLLIVGYMVSHRHTVQSWVSSAPDSESIRLIVLPFTNIGEDASRRYFSDGLVETITSSLTQMEQFQRELWVVPADEARRDDIRSAGQARKIFGVNYVITGSIQPLADRLRLTINLIDSRNLRLINSSVIDVDAGEVLELHNKSVERLMAMLNLEMNPDSREVMQAGKSTIPAAFEQYVQGLGHLQRFERLDNITRAIASFEEAVDLDPRFALAYAGLGQAFWRMYEYTHEPEWVDKAVSHAKTASGLDDQLVQVNITSGMINNGTGNYERAITSYHRALSADPVSAEAYRGLAKAFENTGDYEQAEQTYQRAIRLKPDYWAGYNALGIFYFRQSRYEDAKEPFRKITELTPDNYRGYMNLGSMYYYTDDLEKAGTLYEQSLALEKTYGASSNLATIYYSEGRFEESARMYETALDLHDGSYVMWGNLASAYYWAPDEREKAAETYRRAIELAEEHKRVNPNDPELLINLAGYHAMTGGESEARGYITKALALAPDNTDVMFRAGSAYERLDEREAALHWLGKAVENGFPPSEIKRHPGLRELVTDTPYEKMLQQINSL